MHILSITIPATKDIGTWPMSPDSIGDHVISVDTTLRILTSCSAFPTMGYRRAFIMTRSGMNGIVPPGRLTSRGAVEICGHKLSGTTAHALPQCHSFSFVMRCHKFIALCNKTAHSCRTGIGYRRHNADCYVVACMPCLQHDRSARLYSRAALVDPCTFHKFHHSDISGSQPQCLSSRDVTAARKLALSSCKNLPVYPVL